jgi:superfamily II DNA helicase RecQ
MEKKIKKIIKEEIEKIFEYEDEYFSSFDFEDISDMEPGGDAHKAFLKDLEKEKSFGKYKEPSEKEIENIVNGLKSANLDLPSDQDLIRQAEKSLNRTLNSAELDKIRRTKEKMEKIWGAGSYN